MSIGGIPLELLTMVGSGLLTGVLSLWASSIKARQATHNMMMAAMSKEGELIDKARRYSNPAFQFTRRAIALTAVASIVLLPKLVAIFDPSVNVTVGWTEWDPGFWIFEGSNEVKWKLATGMVITPLDTHLMAGITGMYFGASTVKNA